MLKQCCNYSKQCCNNIATLSCTKNCRCESSCVTSSLVPLPIQMIKDTNFIESTEHNIRDANLQRSKIWRHLIFTTPPPSNVSSPKNPYTSPPQQIDPAHKLTQLLWLRTLFEILHEVHAIKFAFIIVMTK